MDDLEVKRLFKLSARFDKIALDKFDSIFDSEIMLFSQIQANVLTARILGQLSAYNFALCNRALSKLADLPWSDKKKGYVIMNLYSTANFLRPFGPSSNSYICEPIDWWD